MQGSLDQCGNLRLSHLRRFTLGIPQQSGEGERARLTLLAHHDANPRLITPLRDSDGGFRSSAVGDTLVRQRQRISGIGAATVLFHLYMWP